MLRNAHRAGGRNPFTGKTTCGKFDTTQLQDRVVRDRRLVSLHAMRHRDGTLLGYAFSMQKLLLKAHRLGGFQPCNKRTVYCLWLFERGTVTYPFRLSARDVARFGQLYLDGGRWRGRQIVPASGVKASTAAYSVTDRGNMGYGYLWWTLNPDVFGSGAALASGYGGQAIAIVPSKRLVVVQIVDPIQNAKGVRTSDFVKLLQQLAATAP